MDVQGLPWLDLGIGLMLGLSALIGFWRGFAREMLGLLVWVLAIWAAVEGYPRAAELFPVEWDALELTLGQTAFTVTRVRAMLGFATILLLVLLVGSVLGRLIVKHLFADAFRLADRFLGLGFGLLRGAALVVGFVLLAGLTRLPFGEAWSASRFVPVFQAGAEVVIGWLPPEYRDYFSYPPNRPLPFGLGDKLIPSRSQHGSV
jgi:membrane protein required for colicin V production